MSGHVGVPSVQLKGVSEMFRFISRVLHSTLYCYFSGVLLLRFYNHCKTFPRICGIAVSIKILRADCKRLINRKSLVNHRFWNSWYQQRAKNNHLRRHQYYPRHVNTKRAGHWSRENHFLNLSCRSHESTSTYYYTTNLRSLCLLFSFWVGKNLTFLHVLRALFATRIKRCWDFSNK